MILGHLSFHSADGGRSCGQLGNPRAELRAGKLGPAGTLPAPHPPWAELPGNVSIVALAASGLGPRGLQPGLCPFYRHGHTHSQPPWVK